MGGRQKGRAAGPYVVGSATSGILEILIFHPVDTVAKRLMSNTEAIFQSGSKDNMSRLNKVLFKDAVDRSFFGKWLSLFPGVSFGAVYKAVVLLPLDVLKIKSQTNPEVLKGRGVVDLVVKENFKLYRGIGWTMARNCPGSFALFGCNSLVYTQIFGVSGPREAKGYQIFFGSMAGGTASILVSSPLDVIKTRIQNKPFDDPRSGFKVLSDLMRTEGPGALFKGLTPKVGLIGPKLVFSFTVAQWLIKELQNVWVAKGWEAPPAQ